MHSPRQAPRVVHRSSSHLSYLLQATMTGRAATNAVAEERNDETSQCELITSDGVAMTE